MLRPSWWRVLKRLPRLLGTTLWYTAWTAWKVRRLPSVQRPMYRAQRLQEGCRILCRLMGIVVDAPDCPPLPAGQPGLLVANHFSALDPIVLATCWPVAFVGKAELARWPLIGWLCRTYGVLFVERERRTRSVAIIQQMRTWLAAGVPVMVFPEGTTGTGETVRPFKTGAFEAVAGLEEGWVLPVSLCLQRVNGRLATPEVRRWYAWTEGLSFLRHLLRWLGTKHLHLKVQVGTPIPTTGQHRKQLAQQAFEQVRALYHKMLTERMAMADDDRIFSTNVHETKRAGHGL
ncbi:lysophospholipid acyltransferase family protein [Rhodothermus profundi]|uniref:Lyso-ornithine lipid acyltransferase n=1 Tax=Rhodothermus profundi TaxID=633813 RepID=A0A1M6QJC5_9BACT|nr:lysophospholipid acyltransferase family protein [Rhodothermus profundi]SHK20296.1 lyso-ornithine lipid acyltransferase [Rhodothermus profundi]